MKKGPYHDIGHLSAGNLACFLLEFLILYIGITFKLHAIKRSLGELKSIKRLTVHRHAIFTTDSLFPDSWRLQVRIG